MSKRITSEERITTFFTNAPLPAAEVMLNVVKGIVRIRSLAPSGNNQGIGDLAPQPSPKRKRARRPKPSPSGPAPTAPTPEPQEVVA